MMRAVLLAVVCFWCVILRGRCQPGDRSVSQVEYSGDRSLDRCGAKPVVLVFHSGSREEHQSFMGDTLPALSARFAEDWCFVSVNRHRHKDLVEQYSIPAPDALHIYVPSLRVHISSLDVPFTESVLHTHLSALVVGVQGPAPSPRPPLHDDGPPPGLHVVSVNGKDLPFIVVDMQRPFVAVFCRKEDCYGRYRVMEEVEGGARERLGGVASDVVLAVVDWEESEQMLEYFNVTSLPSVAFSMRNSPGEWRRFNGAHSVPELADLVVAVSISDPPPSPPPSSSPSHHTSQARGHTHRHTYNGDQILKEDDDLALFVREFIDPLPPLPPHLMLTDKSFKEHVSSFQATLVGFFLSWSVASKVFLHSFLSAVELNKTPNTSLAVVDCSAYTRLCSQLSILHYPTLILYKGGVDRGEEVRGVVSPAFLLGAIGAVECSAQAKSSLFGLTHGLEELTPATLPRVMGHHVTSPLVLLCLGEGEGEGQEGAWPGEALVGEMVEASEEHSHLVFAWINMGRHGSKVRKLVGDTEIGDVLLVDFTQKQVHRKGGEESVNVFLEMFESGTLQQPTALLSPKAWPPKQPAIKFPS